MSWHAQGVAILFASSEMEEVLGLADRVLVMHEGQLAGELSRAELSEEAVMRLRDGRRRTDLQGKNWGLMTTTEQPATEGKGLPVGISGKGAKIWGIFGLLVAICLYTGISSDQFLQVRNIQNLFHRTSLFGILSIGSCVRHHHERHRLVDRFACVPGRCALALFAHSARVARLAGGYRRDGNGGRNWTLFTAS